MAHLHELRKGMKSIELQDTLSSPDGRTLTIPLELAMTPVLNAEKYFNKAKKTRTAHDDALTRMKSLEVRLSTLRMLHDEIADVQSNEALKQFQQTYKVQLQQAGYLTVKEQENLPPFRIFTVEGGFQVLAGKSSDNNDMLTMKYAKPNDLWFHCRGSSGSHVVLKMNSALGDPSKAAIHQAASIAAYYSKMKNASSVPVAMTEKKFVRKPKGAPAGTVILEREKVIFVQPKLPFPSN
jgi:predicted ribosome quality control (RQC) complex YloA/Tae2 family protein